MIYPKTYLERLVQDAVECYKSMVIEQGVPKRREKQIKMLEALFKSVQYDTMLIKRIKQLIVDIDTTNSGWIRWIYVPRSKFSAVLTEAISEYEKAIRCLEAQQLECSAPITAGAAKSSLVHSPSVGKEMVSSRPIIMPQIHHLMEQARALCDA